MSWCRSLWVHLVCGSLTFWTRMYVSFPKFGKFSAICSNKFSALSLFTFWDPYNANVSITYVLEALNLSSFFSFCLSVDVFHCPSFRSLIHLFTSSNLLLIPSSVFFIVVLVFFNSFGFFLYFLSRCWSSHFIYSFQNLMNIFMTITLNSLAGRLLISVSFHSFFEFFSYSFIWNSSVSLCCLTVFF